MLSRLAALAAAWGAARRGWHDSVRRWRWRVAVLTAAAGLGLIGCAFLSGGLYLYIAARAEPWQAAAATGGLVAAIAALLALLSRLSRRRRPAPRDEFSGLATTALEEALRGAPVKSSDLMLAGLVAGIALGTVSRSRNRRAPDARPAP